MGEQSTVSESHIPKSGCSLHDFDQILCSQVIANVRWNLDDNHIKQAVERLSPPLSKCLFGDTGEDIRFSAVPSMILNESELLEIADAVRFLPLPATCYWLPAVSHYSNATLCTGEIRRRLAPAEASRWAEKAAEFTRKLQEPQLELAEGVDVVNEWTQDLRRYLEALGEYRYLPRPHGQFPTPTRPQAGVSVEPIASELAYVERMRTAIAQHSDRSQAAPDELVKSAKANRQLALKALRILEKRGEYKGFGRNSTHSDS